MLKYSRYSVVLLVLVLGFFCLGMGAKLSSRPVPPSPGQEYLFHNIDNFDTANYKKQPNWWVFDSVNISYETVTEDNHQQVLAVKGNASNWYVGGVGTYIGTDAGRYTHLQMDVYGNGPDSGSIKIEAFEDDNGNYQIEQDPKNGFAPLFDDKWSYSLNVDWKGWKTVDILLSDFKDENPGVGDDVWNPTQEGGSGGLIQAQLVLTASKPNGVVNLKIDNIKLVKYMKND